MEMIETPFESYAIVPLATILQSLMAALWVVAGVLIAAAALVAFVAFLPVAAIMALVVGPRRAGARRGWRPVAA